MLVSAIVAISANGVIGRENGIPWYLPDDLKWFKKNTLGHHVIMGRKTYETLGRPLPNRTNVVVTRDLFFVASGCVVVHSVDEALRLALDNGEQEAVIIGGGQIYRQTEHYWDKLYLTEVDVELEGDTFFSAINAADWRETFREFHPADERHDYAFTFKILERIS